MGLELTTDRYPTNMQTTECMCTIFKHNMRNYPEMFIIILFICYSVLQSYVISCQ